jgi:hypothetical protein
MLTTGQLEEFFPELSDERVVSPLALVHSRFSTNTFPSWPLAHPYRFIAHNGEINTVKGNRNWMRARESLLASDVIPGDLKRLFPIVEMSGSDSASFDEVLAIATPKTLLGTLGKVVSSELAEEVPSAVTPFRARTLNLTFEPLASALNFTLKVVELTVWVRPEFASVTT